ncbi:hypothetical protein PEL8287_03185 [Roseovarius litorisediminis]|uniref:Copper chaperone PCu(A)C n=1 Tax=Roseovarius litorisediminis TaxID=1312363 RepID=A0A1Y5TAI4_9RHOB|nr:copper chaperone PCu(A)C [Roseovarius litorisediminis]SLN59081.1 hypothetical protein PEL8287_03185 [Roseovarius litorisediminis]
MSFKSTVLAAMTAATLALPAFAQDIMILDSYARSASPVAKSGAAFLVIENRSDQDDRLIGVASPAAKLVQMHTHTQNSEGVMQMRHVKEGFALPGEGMIMMERGGNHVMFMGLNVPFKQGDLIPLTLTFEKAGDIKVEVPVDLERQPGMGHKHKNTE